MDQTYLETVCCVNGGSKRCRYLDDSKGCLKLTSDKEVIDQEVREYVESSKGLKYRPQLPFGDNCDGYAQ